jgi:hypothetical protein
MKLKLMMAATGAAFAITTFPTNALMTRASFRIPILIQKSSVNDVAITTFARNTHTYVRPILLLF